MAPRNDFRRVLLLAVGLAWTALPTLAFADNPKGPATAEQVRAALDQKITLDFSSQNMDEALGHLQDKTGISFVLDSLVLQQLGMGGGPNDAPTPVRLKATQGRDRVRTALHRMLEPYQLTYVILGDRVLVTTEDVAHYRQMRQRVSVEANAIPVGDALQALAKQTAVNLVIDGRVGKQVKTPVTLEQDDVTLETALRLLTFMADVRAVVIANVVLVTTEERADRLTKQPETPRPPLIGGVPEMLEVPGRGGPPPVPAGAGSPVPPRFDERLEPPPPLRNGPPPRLYER
jgi:type II secretory pathway component GspD/PulD (secretin)